ncbi:MAG: hypothetical protein JO257_21225 [Deltaproteobacteria bacterium]|nr:hypothetical protein [Deltaproteobacteria bacterium]
MALALGTRRSTIAAVGSALLAMALAIGLAGRSCRVEPPGPEVTVHDLLHAASAGDRDTVYELLAPATQQRLDVEARRATDLVGATMRYSAKDLISIGASEGVAAPTDITVLEQRGDRATVQVVGPSGRSLVQLVRVEGRWRVELPEYGRGL